MEEVYLIASQHSLLIYSSPPPCLTLEQPGHLQASSWNIRVEDEWWAALDQGLDCALEFVVRSAFGIVILHVVEAGKDGAG
jgi:hypothetical protein